MTKVKANALWNLLSPEQLETLDQWLFEENPSYADALPSSLHYQEYLEWKASKKAGPSP